jgi:hypothetical protein
MGIEMQASIPRHPRRWARAFATVLGLCLVAPACDPDRPPGLSNRVVKLEDVPEVVMKAAKAKVPGVKFEEAWKNVDREGKLHSYEIRGKNAKGKIREARVAPSGEILELE